MTRVLEVMKAAICSVGCLSMRREGRCASEDGTCLVERGTEQIARAVLTALDDAGYVVLPRDPTDDMVAQFAVDDDWSYHNAQSVWDAMLRAAPKVIP